jgi:uncharacterized membrane protein YfcA
MRASQALWRQAFLYGVMSVLCVIGTSILAIKYAPENLLAVVEALLLAVIAGYFAVLAWLFRRAARHCDKP